jgi:glycosyltransferase involved in cell wall biosynthesis
LVRLRVLLTSPLLLSGVITHVCDLAERLQALGIRPHLALTDSNRTGLALPGHVPATVPVHFIDTAGELSGLARNLRIALIHSHSPLTLDSSRIVAEELSVALVITLHGIIDWPRRYPEALTYASGIIATGPETARSAGPDYNTKTTVILNGVNLERFRPPGFETAGKYPLRILYFGRTKGADTKGLAALDKAVQILRQQGRKLEAKMAGHAAGVFPVNLQRCGWVHDPIPYLHWSHVVFGRGRSLREAMACGNAGFLLGQGYGGVVRREWFSRKAPPSFSSTPGLGAGEPDVDVISAHLAELDDNRILLQALRKEARLTAKENFDSYHMAKKTVKVYIQALR